jgi:hypothetical protein
MLHTPKSLRAARPGRRASKSSIAVLCGAVGLALLASWPADHTDAAPYVKSKTLAVSSPAQGTAVWVRNYYTQTQGQEMASLRNYQTSSDSYFDWEVRYSQDNGGTWGAWQALPTPSPAPLPAMHYQNPLPGWVDPVNGLMLQMVNDGTLPTNTPQEGYSRWQLDYRVSNDGGRTFAVDQQVIQAGYTSTNPLPGVVLGQTAVLIGATTCTPLRTSQGKVLVPCQTTENSGGFLDAHVLIGTWSGTQMQWNLSPAVTVTAAKSTRGLFEPTIAEMPDGRILMVTRASNGGNSGIASYKWYSVSSDGGSTWSTAQPWTYDDGSSFYSPSSCSQLLRLSNGKYYWLGNITPTNASGDLPRYPLVLGEVDPTTLLLEKNSLVTIDTKGAADSTAIQLSNFLAYEDRSTGDIVLNMTRATNVSNVVNGDSYTYVISGVPEPSCVAMLSAAVIGGALCLWRRRR